MNRWLVGTAWLAIAGLGAWQGDDLAASVAALDTRVTAIEERLEDRPLGTAKAGGSIRFAGSVGGDTVSEPFDLPAGTVLITYEDAGTDAIVRLHPAPGTGNRASFALIDGPSSDSDASGTIAVPLPTGGRYVVAAGQSDTGSWSIVVDASGA